MKKVKGRDYMGDTVGTSESKMRRQHTRKCRYRVIGDKFVRVLKEGVGSS